MTLPASGAISLNNVNVELGLSGTASISMNDANVRSLFAVPSGQISMSNGYGKTWRDGSTSARAATSAQAIKQATGTTTSGVYWILVNGSPKQVYCDMNGTYTGDAANGYMLYQNFGSSPFQAGRALVNTGQSNFSSNGWSPQGGSSQLNGDNLWSWNGGFAQYNTFHSWQLSSPSASVLRIRWGNANNANNATLFVNGVNTRVVGPSEITITQANFTPTTNMIQLQEVGGIVAAYWIFVR